MMNQKQGRLRMWLALIAAIIHLPALSYESFPETKHDPYEGREEMNGLRLKQFGDFTKWDLITVRYRRDSGELRFVYANSLAAKGLRAGSKSYEDGSVFAKIGIKTVEDTAFPSSIEPSGAARFQYMVKDRRKYAKTGGWGYALFDSSGKTFPGEPGAAITACHACHRLVPNRDFVFSKDANLTGLLMQTAKKIAPAFSEHASSLKWRTVDRNKLPEEIQNQIPHGDMRVEVVTGEVQDNLFLGTLDEIRPALIQKVMETGRPAVLYSLDGRRYSLIFKSPTRGEECKENETRFMHALKSTAGAVGARLKVVCQ